MTRHNDTQSGFPYPRLPNGKLQLILLTLACLVPLHLTAAEVWTWTDENGVVHYGEVPPENIKATLLGEDQVSIPTLSGNDPASGTPAEGEKSYAQQRREDIAKEKKDRRTSQAEIQEHCDFHRKRLAEVEPVRRVIYTNDEGEAVRMDDNERLALVDESKAFLEEYCR